MIILSIMWGTCSTAALMIDGEIVSCVSEERFSRQKNDEAYPKQAIEHVLNQARLSPGKLDLVVFGGERFDAKSVILRKYSKWSVQDRLREQHEIWQPVLYEKRTVSELDVFGDKLDVSQYPGQWDDVIEFLRNGNKAQTNEFLKAFRRRVVAEHLGTDEAKVVFVDHHRAHAYYAYYASPIRRE